MTGRGLEAPLPAAALALVAVLLIGACQEVGESSIDLLAPAPAEGASFSADVQPILTANCALSGCHAGGAPEPQVCNVEPFRPANFEPGSAYDNLVGVPSCESTLVNGGASPNILNRVQPFDLASSYMYLKIEDCRAEIGCFGLPMPFGLSPLNEAERAVIRQWIESGAPDN